MSFMTPIGKLFLNAKGPLGIRRWYSPVYSYDPELHNITVSKRHIALKDSSFLSKRKHYLSSYAKHGAIC